jgi:hypothetical protein
LIAKSPEAIEIAPLDAVEIAVEPWTWPFAQARRADMDRHFAARQRERPTLWNGRVLLLHHYLHQNGVLRGASFETDYASFLAWRDWGCPAAGVFNVFADAALQSADGAFCWAKWRRSPRLPGNGFFRAARRTATISARAACSTLPVVWLANCSRRPALISASAKSSRAGRRVRRLVETGHSKRKCRAAACEHHASPGERSAAGIFRHPHRARACGSRSSHAALACRISGGRMVRKRDHAHALD